MQFPLPGQVTAPSRPSRLVASTDHFLPFQCSATVAPLPRRPTARQSLAQVQEMPYGRTAAGCLFSGWAAHFAPFHPSGSSRNVVLP